MLAAPSLGEIEQTGGRYVENSGRAARFAISGRSCFPGISGAASCIAAWHGGTCRLRDAVHIGKRGVQKKVHCLPYARVDGIAAAHERRAFPADSPARRNAVARRRGQGAPAARARVQRGGKAQHRARFQHVGTGQNGRGGRVSLSDGGKGHPREGKDARVSARSVAAGLLQKLGHAVAGRRAHEVFAARRVRLQAAHLA